MAFGEYSRSLPQKLCLTLSHLVAVGCFCWLLFGGGFGRLASWLPLGLTPGNPARRAFLLTCALLYLFRVMLTSFWFLKRKMGWGEVATIVPWLYIIYFCFAIWGGTNPRQFGLIGTLGLALYALGSYLNTASEYQRLRWKQRPENRGKLFTGGLFRYARHINYFGDEVLFTGLAFVAGNPLALIIPALMAALFAGINIPVLDRYLGRRYGEAFKAYADRTKKFVPFVY